MDACSSVGQLAERSVILLLPQSVTTGAPGMSGLATRTFPADDGGEAANGCPERRV